MGICKLWSAVLGLVWWEPCLWGFATLVGSSGPRLVGPCLWGFASFGRHDGPRLVGAVSMGICKLWSVGAVSMEALVGSDGPRLLGAGSLGICKLWSAVVGGSRVYGDLQLWSAVLGFVWWEPCLWRFAALAPNEAQNCRPKLQISMDTAPTKRGSKTADQSCKSP